jgi:hypothetical protein
MKIEIVLTIVVACLPIATGAPTQDSPSTQGADESKPKVDLAQPSAKDVATAYFEALTQADLEKVDSLVSVPFSLGGKDTVKDIAELAKKNKEIVAQKGKRAVPAYTVSIPKDAKGLDRTTFPSWEVYRISITNTEYQLDIYVLAGVTPKVIGWTNANRR